MKSAIDNYPDLTDAGKNVKAILDDGRIVTGIIIVADYFFDGEEEIPLIALETEGENISFGNCKEYEFINNGE